MAMALELAERGAGWTSPNPMVGAVLVKDGAVIGRGWHRRMRRAPRRAGGTGGLHLLPRRGHPLRHPGALLPPGASAPLYRRHPGGRGLHGWWWAPVTPTPWWRAGAWTSCGPAASGWTPACSRGHADALNRVFFHYIQSGQPYVVLKYAMTLDGKTATRTGASRWITGEEARRRVHRDRHRCSAILVGIGTALADDPMLHLPS